jgi:flagellar protein FliS
MDLTGYRKAVLDTTDRVQIVLMLYDGALNHMKVAKRKIEAGDIRAKCAHLGKVTAIISELSNVLDMEKGGEIAERLRSLYTYSLQRLLDANLKNDVSAVEDVEQVISLIRDGWKEMMRSEHAGKKAMAGV